MVAPVRCAPPANKPTPAERAACAPWLERELAFVASSVRSIVVLGGYGWQALWPAAEDRRVRLPPPRTAFGHGVEVALTTPGGGAALLIGCYHPSQQNTFTGRVTEEMLDAVLTRARAYAGLPRRAT